MKWGVLFFILLWLFWPVSFKMPVQGADKADYNQKSFWYYPWGKSGTHKGVDIFSAEGTAIHSSTPGLVLFTGNVERGGNVVVVLSPGWEIHYYAHLQKISTSLFSWVNARKTIGTLGTTGNAKGKSPHLHYSIVHLIPRPWLISTEHQGWKKMFYKDPIPLLNQSLDL